MGVVSYLDPTHKGRGSISSGLFPIVSPRIQACVTKLLFLWVGSGQETKLARE